MKIFLKTYQSKIIFFFIIFFFIILILNYYKLILFPNPTSKDLYIKLSEIYDKQTYLTGRNAGMFTDEFQDFIKQKGYYVDLRPTYYDGRAEISATPVPSN